MLKKVLIANRGEIALRIIRACHEMGIKTCAVYSKADENSLFVKLADESYSIGEVLPAKSYLNVDKILTVAKARNCDGIHPGYGFLSESYYFANLVRKNKIKFIGPDPETIKNMGNKSLAIKTMRENGVPTVPGSDGNVKSVEEAIKIAEKISYPLLLKASSGGGGKGIRRVDSREELVEKFPLVKMEAKASFKDDSIYMEKLIENPRHIEVQILCDDFSNILCLGERNCSIQRENQKMIEESPSPGISQGLREKLYDAARKSAKACAYKNAGTVEFLVDKDENFYFLEMNTRIQVEHPITEMVTGVDLVKSQLKIASGLDIKNLKVEFKGHAIEARIIAKDPLNNFAVSCGRVNFFHEPGGVDTRFDSDLFTGSEISPYYDSMVGKLIVKDRTRTLAIKKLRRALEETFVSGISTNIWYLYTICHDFSFIKGNYDTSFIKNNEENILKIMRSYYDKFLE